MSKAEEVIKQVRRLKGGVRPQGQGFSPFFLLFTWILKICVFASIAARYFFQKKKRFVEPSRRGNGRTPLEPFLYFLFLFFLSLIFLILVDIVFHFSIFVLNNLLLLIFLFLFCCLFCVCVFFGDVFVFVFFLKKCFPFFPLFLFMFSSFFACVYVHVPFFSFFWKVLYISGRSSAVGTKVWEFAKLNLATLKCRKWNNLFTKTSFFVQNKRMITKNSQKKVKNNNKKNIFLKKNSNSLKKFLETNKLGKSFKIVFWRRKSLKVSKIWEKMRIFTCMVETLFWWQPVMF